MVKKRLFYGWINLAVLWFCYMLILGSITYGFGIIVNDMRLDLGLTMTLASGGYTGYQLSQALFAPLLGKCAQRYGSKICIIIGGLSMAIGCGLMAFAVKGVFLYYFVWIFFIGIAVRFAASAACQINISKWFFKKRGLAMAIFFTSGGLGGYIFTNLLSNLIKYYSWRSVWVVMMLCGVLTVLLVLFILKEDPKDIGQQIDGGESTGAAKSKLDIGKYVPAFAAITKTSDNWTLKEARKNKTFYYLIFFQFVVSFYMVSIGNLGISYLGGLPLGADAAAKAIAMYSLANIFGRLLVGILNDHIDSKCIFAVSTVLMGVGLACMMFAKNTAMAFTFSWVGGIGFGMFIVTPSNALVNYFGSRHYPEIVSSFGFISGIICGFNSLIMGALCDLTGSSFIVWIISLGFVAVSLLLSLTMKIPTKAAELKAQE